MHRIVMFTNTYAPMVGGLERSVATVHEDLNGSGHVSRVITPEAHGAPDAEAGVLRLPAVTGLGKKRFSLPLPGLGRVGRWVEAIDPHVLHAHQPFLLGSCARRLATRRDIPLVFTFHTLYERYAHYVPLPAEPAREWISALATRFANQSDVVIAPTPSVRELLIARGVQRRIEIAPTGINRSRFLNRSREAARRRLGLHPDDEVVGHLGRITREKNIRYLIEAMLHLMAARPRVKWLLVGQGDELQRARTVLSQAGVGERLITPGVLLNEAAADAYAAMDLFVFASHTDTQALVLAEAMSAGSPVIALDAPGARDCIADGLTGQLLPANTPPPDFAVAVSAQLADKNGLAALSAGARARSVRFERSICLARMVEIYDMAREMTRALPRFEATQSEPFREDFGTARSN